MTKRRMSSALALGAATLAMGGCVPSGTANAPVYVCAAQDSDGRRITCDVPQDTNPGDGCRCITRATGDRGPDTYFGRIVTQ